MTQRLIDIREEALSHVQVAVAEILAANGKMQSALKPLFEEMDGIEAPNSFKAAIIRDIFAKLNEGVGA